MYEDYMQNLLGFPTRQYPNTYDEQNFNPYGNFYETMYQRQEWRNSASNDDLESCYPEIYNIVYPMVRKVCMSNTMPINQTVIDNMVNEISTNLEANGTIELNINLNNQVMENRNPKDLGAELCSKERENRSSECESSNRQVRRNPFINDLIKILIIRELLRLRGNRPGNRPPFPLNRPPMQGGRPPMPRYDGIDGDNYYYNPGVENRYLRF